MKDEKVKAVKEQRTSTNINKVENFLQFANFYRCFIKKVSYIAKSLKKLKGTKEQKQEKEY